MYGYSLRVAGKLCLPIAVRTLPLLLSRHKNPPIHRPHDLEKFKGSTIFCEPLPAVPYNNRLIKPIVACDYGYVLL
jgi:hypothetical protein